MVLVGNPKEFPQFVNKKKKKKKVSGCDYATPWSNMREIWLELTLTY